MYPYIRIPSLGYFDSWQVMSWIAFSVGGALSFFMLKKEIAARSALGYAFAIMMAALVGGHLTHCLTHWACYSHILFQLMYFWSDGRSSFGAMAGSGLVLLVLRVKTSWEKFLRILDDMVLSWLLALTLMRIGCYMKGCCWGTLIAESHPFYGISFKFIQNRYVALHPVQLYDAAFSAGLLSLLLLMRRVGPMPGFIAALFGLLYGAGRFVIEYFRGDAQHLPLIFDHLRLNQFLALMLIFVSGMFLLHLIQRMPIDTPRHNY